MNTLCFDFGNTRLKIAFFQNAKLAEVIVIENDEIATIGSILEKFDAQKTILSSLSIIILRSKHSCKKNKISQA
jgi:hypothetical protein